MVIYFEDEKEFKMSGAKEIPHWDRIEVKGIVLTDLEFIVDPGMHTTIQNKKYGVIPNTRLVAREPSC